MINGIQNNSYPYGYQASINNIRLNNILQNRLAGSKAVSPVLPVPADKESGSNLSDSISYLKSYSASMTDLMSSANSLRSGNTGSVVNQLEATSADSAILSSSKNGRLTSPTTYDVTVEQLAKSQVNLSGAVDPNSKAAGDLSMQLQAGGKTVNVEVSSFNESGNQKTNSQMLSEAAAAINKAGAGVKASVVTKDGQSSLKLESVKTGTANSFTVTGDFADSTGLADSTQQAQNASYTVTSGGQTKSYSSQSNEVSMDYGKINMTLKAEGSTSVGVGISTQKMVSSMEDLVKNYNSTVDLLTKNQSRGSGNTRQLSSLQNYVTGSKESMEKLGLSFNKDGTLALNKTKLTESLTKEPGLTKDLISGSSGIAQRAFSAATSGAGTSAGSLVGNDVAQNNYRQAVDTVNMMNSFSKRGAFNMMNYSVVGLLFNGYA